MPEENLGVELAISELRRSVDVGLTEIRGQLALLLQRSDQADRRADAMATALEDLEQRLRATEQTTITRVDLDNRTRKIVAIVAVLVALAGVAATLALGLIRL